MTGIHHCKNHKVCIQVNEKHNQLLCLEGLHHILIYYLMIYIILKQNYTSFRPQKPALYGTTWEAAGTTLFFTKMLSLLFVCFHANCALPSK